MSFFIDREDAGHQLAKLLGQYKNAKKTIILALPRGGVPIASTLSKELSIPYDILLVRKLGHPYHPEFAFGAISVGDVMIINPPYTIEDVLKQPIFEQVIREEKIELARRNHIYRQDRAWPDLNDHTVIIVDDGIATGATMKAGISSVKKMGCHKINVAVPVMPREEYEQFSHLVNNLYVCHTPYDFRAVGLWYSQFNQVSDEEVMALLSEK